MSAILLLPLLPILGNDFLKVLAQGGASRSGDVGEPIGFHCNLLNKILLGFIFFHQVFAQGLEVGNLFLTGSAVGGSQFFPLPAYAPQR